jgi:DNA-binding HxlR family transcriptional regulator
MPDEQRIPDGIQHLIVLLVLSDDHDERWSRAELKAELDDPEPQVISNALEHLEGAGVVHLDGEQVWASRCVRHLDALGSIGI